MDRTVILAADRRARCAVEVPAKPEPAEKTAGEELAHYIWLHRHGFVGAEFRGNINNFLLGHLWGVDKI